MEEISRQIEDKMRKIGFMMRRSGHRERRGNAPDTQNRVLAILHMNDGIPQKQIGFILGIRPQSCGEVIAKMESGGWIRRETDEFDKRAHLVYLTEEGKRLSDALFETASESLFDSLEEEERGQLDSLLGKVISLNEDLLERPQEREDEEDEDIRRHAPKERFDEDPRGFRDHRPERDDRRMEDFRGGPHRRNFEGEDRRGPHREGTPPFEEGGENRKMRRRGDYRFVKEEEEEERRPFRKHEEIL